MHFGLYVTTYKFWPEHGANNAYFQGRKLGKGL